MSLKLETSRKIETAYPTRRFRIAVDEIWPKGERPRWPCLRGTSRADLVAFARLFPASAGMLSTYYEFLFASLDAGGAMVADAMGLIDFGVTPTELAEIFPAYQSGLPRVLHQLTPILEETRGRGGLRIYHESFRRHILDKAQQRGDKLGPKLKDVIAWLEGRGFLEDSRAYRFLLPNLVRADRAAEAFARIDINFVATSCAAGHSATAIETNLALFANLAARALDFPKLIRAIELFRSLGACIDNLHDHFEYGSAYAAIFGASSLLASSRTYE